MKMARDIQLPVHAIFEAFTLQREGWRVWWNKRPDDHFKTKSAAKAWNSRWAGIEAFTSDNGKGYATTTFTLKGERFRLQAHRVITVLETGDWPDHLVDHMDGDPSNNSPSNLRDATLSVNARNSRMSRRNTSGRTGVYWIARVNLWNARIVKDKKPVSLGYFRDFEDAVAARTSAEQAYGYTHRHGSAS